MYSHLAGVYCGQFALIDIANAIERYRTHFNIHVSGGQFDGYNYLIKGYDKQNGFLSQYCLTEYEMRDLVNMVRNDPYYNPNGMYSANMAPYPSAVMGSSTIKKVSLEDKKEAVVLSAKAKRSNNYRKLIGHRNFKARAVA